jgi:hypothetical protein
MDRMWHRRLHRFAVSAAVLGLTVTLSLFGQDQHRGRKYKAPPPTSRVDVTILRNEDGKPIENAAVVFQLIGDKGNMELKTNEDGKTVIDVLPTGSKVTMQVIAKGFQTYGADYTIDKAQMAIEVKLKRPGKQYSIYTDHSHDESQKQNSGAGNSPEADKSADANKDATKSQPAESAKQSDSKPDSNQPQPQ